MTHSVLFALLIWVGQPLNQTGPILNESHWSILKKLHNYTEKQDTRYAHELGEMKRRMRSSAWLPSIGFTYRFVQDDWNRTTVEDSQGLTDLSVDNSIRFGRRYQLGFELSWRPAELLYHPDELRIIDAARRFDAKRQARKVALTDAFLNWMKASPTYLISPTIESLRSAKQKQLHWALILNSLTEGAFSKMVLQTYGNGDSK